MKALISPNELHGGGVRVAEVREEEFPVAEPLYWVDCPDTTHADMFYVDGQFFELPMPEPEEDQIPTTEM